MRWTFPTADVTGPPAHIPGGIPDTSVSRTFRNNGQLRDGEIVVDHDRIGCRSFFARETTPYRLRWQRKYRRRVNDLVRQARFEEIPPPRRTSGWLTW